MYSVVYVVSGVILYLPPYDINSVFGTVWPYSSTLLYNVVTISAQIWCCSWGGSLLWHIHSSDYDIGLDCPYILDYFSSSYTSVWHWWKKRVPGIVKRFISKLRAKIILFRYWLKLSCVGIYCKFIPYWTK